MFLLPVTITFFSNLHISDFVAKYYVQKLLHPNTDENSQKNVPKVPQKLSYTIATILILQVLQESTTGCSLLFVWGKLILTMRRKPTGDKMYLNILSTSQPWAI